MACVPETQTLGASPANISWTVVRGDSSKLRIDFLESDEKTSFNTYGWTYLATAYDSVGDILDDLPVIAGDGYAEISIPSDVTANWGTKYRNIVAELPFDLQVSIQSENITWTPVIGTICVLADISPGVL